MHVNKNNLSLSIIMPALNEEANIEIAIRSTLAALDEFEIDGEIIVINDGSNDSTKNVVQRLIESNSRLKMISHEIPMGIGYSFFDGVKISKRDVVVMFPADNEMNLKDSLSFFHLMDDVDIIVPFFHNTEVRDRFRRLISSLYRFIITVSFGINLNYTNGTVFYRKCILEKFMLKSHGFFYQTEILVKMIRRGYLFAEVPNFLTKRLAGKSKATTLKSLYQVVKNYFILFFEIHIKRIEAHKDFRKINPNSVSHHKYIATMRD